MFYGCLHDQQLHCKEIKNNSKILAAQMAVHLINKAVKLHCLHTM